MCFDQATVISVFTQMYREMIKLGFKVILILLGHWGQIQQDALRIARETVEQEIKEKNLAVKILGLRWADYLIGMGYGGHGKEGETAMIWRIEPTLRFRSGRCIQFSSGRRKCCTIYD